ncbi:PH domain-containing protein [Pseudogracilibacillus sp. SE30717A]|uniref:PH domain-containing protein n=1 Tax=Pseudogracilibacillus sp. SE30717A TaxID=3098293 RepID=UPI00300E363A
MMCNEQELRNENPFSKPQRLHPAAMYFNLIKVIKETIFGLGIGLIFTLKESLFYFLLFISIFLILLIISSILSWLRFTYRIEENELRIEQGIFIRKKRYISLNRIHKIDLTANVIHRIFKLVKVQIDTASSGDGAEVSLSAIKTEDAVRLRKVLKRQETLQNIVETDESNSMKKISWIRLFIAGTTSGSVGIILVALLAGFTQIEELIPKKLYNTTYTWIIDQGIIIIVGLIIFMLLLLWLFGIAGTMIKYGNFTIEKRAAELFVKRGLLETKELTIPFDRIQAIGIEQSLIRQPIKFVRIFAVVAGGSFDKMEPFPVLFPLIHEKEVEQFLREYLPDYQQQKTELIPLSKRGRKFYLFNTTILFVLALIPVLYFFPSFSWIPLCFIILSLALGWMQHKDGGYMIDGKRITLQHRNLNKVTIMTYHRRIQSLQKRQHKIQMYQRIASTKISLIGMGGLGTHYSLKHVEEEDANKIADWYSYRKQVEED